MFFYKGRRRRRDFSSSLVHISLFAVLMLLRRRNSQFHIRSYYSWHCLDTGNNIHSVVARNEPSFAVSVWSFPITLLPLHHKRFQHRITTTGSTPTPQLDHTTTIRSILMSSQQQSSHGSSSSSSSSSSCIYQQDEKPKVVIIAGPTGTGKSDVAAIICDMMKGIIVSADSVQVYDKVQIGANKPSIETLQHTPHILLNLVDHTTPYTYNTAEWRRDAIFAIQHLVMPQNCSTASFIYSKEMECLSEQTMAEDQQRQEYILSTIQVAKNAKDTSIGKETDDTGNMSSEEGRKTSSYLPVVVGGTMMYVQWLVHGRPDAVRPSDTAVQEAQQVITQYCLTNDWNGAIEYVSDQGKVFQQQVQKLFPSDWYRLRRILEVAITVKASSMTIPMEQVYSGIRENGLSAMGYDVRCFFLCPDDRMKHTKIVDLRCEQMIMRGLLEETTNLVINNEMPDMVSRAIGYRQSIEYLQRENPVLNDYDSFHDYIAKFTAATRQYSQRQMKWFRRETDFMFIPVPLNEDDPKRRIQQVANKLIQYIKMTKEEYDAELQTPSSESHAVRFNNAEQAKGMKVYQLEKRILVNNSSDLLQAVTIADDCTLRFQAAKQKRRIEHITATDVDDNDTINRQLQNDRSDMIQSNVAL